MFSNIKSMFLAAFSALLGGYVLLQKYKAYKAEDNLKSIEMQIAKTNVIVAKENAKAKAETRELESSTAINTLKELKVQREETLKEMDKIEKEIQKTPRRKKFTIQG